MYAEQALSIYFLFIDRVINKIFIRFNNLDAFVYSLKKWTTDVYFTVYRFIYECFVLTDACCRYRRESLGHHTLQVPLFLLGGFSGRWVQVFTFLRITPKRLNVESWNFHTM